MSLLTHVMDHSLDEGYAEAAARREADGTAGLPRTLKAKLGLAAGLVLAAMVVTLGAAEARLDAPVLAKERQELIDRVERADDRAHALEGDIDRLRTDVAARQRAALKQPGGGQGELVSLLSGATEVRGPGVKLVVDDAKGSSSGGGGGPRESAGFSDTGRLRDRDMQKIVNGLWQSGAEAVSINGQRLTELSAIRPPVTRYWSTTDRWSRRTRCWRWGTRSGSARPSRTRRTASTCTCCRRATGSGTP